MNVHVSNESHGSIVCVSCSRVVGEVEYTGAVWLRKIRLLTVSPDNFTVQCRGQNLDRDAAHGHIFRVRMIVGDRTVRRPRPTVQALDCLRRVMPRSCSEFNVDPKFLFDSGVGACLDEFQVRNIN